MRKFGLIGYPLSHSFSRDYFQDKFHKEGITDCLYQNFPMESISGLRDLIDSTPDLFGLNVTIPYKEKVIPYLDQVTDVVQQTGACNCIVIHNKRLKGHNTDVAGFRISLEKNLKSYHDKALILGEGGAAKAVAYVLRTLNIPFIHVVRRKLHDEHIHFSELSAAILEQNRLIINTTPVGMYPDVDETPLENQEGVGEQHYLYDLIYNPAKTRFLKDGEDRGSIIQNGYEMLIIQAEESWKIWNEFP